MLFSPRRQRRVHFGIIFTAILKMEYASEQEKVLEEEDDWVDTHHYSDKEVSDKVGEMKLEERQPEILGKPEAEGAEAPNGEP